MEMDEKLVSVRNYWCGYGVSTFFATNDWRGRIGSISNFQVIPSVIKAKRYDNRMKIAC